MNIEYKLSGKPGNIFLVGLILGPTLTTLLCIIYSFIDVLNPFIYVTFLVYACLLAGIVYIQLFVIKVSKCRSFNSALLYGLIVGAFGVYANWCTFTYVMLEKNNTPIELLQIMESPSYIMTFANNLAVEGYYSIFGINVNGGFLWFIWIVEALGIFVIGILGGAGVMHEQVFCENCSKWAKKDNTNLRLSITNDLDYKKLIRDDVNELLNLPIYTGLNEEHLKVNLQSCTKCQNTHTIDLDLIYYTYNNKGEIEEKNDDFSEVYILNNDQYQNFINKNKST